MRAARALALAAAILGLSLGTAASAPSIEGTLTGYAQSPRFQVFGGGHALEGGAYEWTLVCGECLVRVSLLEPNVLLVQSDHAGYLPPGTYEVRDFRGLFMHTGDAGDYAIALHGTGHLVRL